MMFVVQAMSENYLARTICRRDSVRDREIIQPHDNKMQKMDEHGLGELFIGKSANNVSRTLLYDSDFRFDFADVLVCCRSIKRLRSGTWFLTFSNSLSMRISLMRNPALL